MAGLLADRVGTWAPFAAGAALALPVTIVIRAPALGARASAPSAARRAGRAAARTATGWSSTRCSPPSCSDSSAAWAICSGSLRLSENGLSPSGIGVLFSIGALVWIAVAPLAGRMGEQRSHVALTAFGCALLGAAWLVPVADRSTVAIAAFLLASAPAARASTRSATCSPAAGPRRPAPAAARSSAS